jgi:hypothetical protein
LASNGSMQDNANARRLSPFGAWNARAETITRQGTAAFSPAAGSPPENPQFCNCFLLCRMVLMPYCPYIIRTLEASRWPDFSLAGQLASRLGNVEVAGTKQEWASRHHLVSTLVLCNGSSRHSTVPVTFADKRNDGLDRRFSCAGRRTFYPSAVAIGGSHRQPVHTCSLGQNGPSSRSRGKNARHGD